MITIYVNKRSEMTAIATSIVGVQMYRTRLTCNCKHSNRRNGILLVLDDTIVYKTIQCKACTKEQGGVIW